MCLSASRTVNRAGQAVPHQRRGIQGVSLLPVPVSRTAGCPAQLLPPSLVPRALTTVTKAAVYVAGIRGVEDTRDTQ